MRPGRNNAVRDAAALIKQIRQANAALGGAIERMRTAHKDAGGKPAFERQVNSKLGLKYRKAMYLRNIHIAFRQAGVSEDSIPEIGWSKAKELARLDPTDLKRRFNALVAFAKANTREQLIEHLATHFEIARYPRRRREGPRKR